MRILAVNGSPRGKDGNTEQLLRSFLGGAWSAGAEAEVIYLKEKRINHCLGCSTCLLKTPGVCVHKDDMPELLEKLCQADIIVYATPLYFYTFTGLMKDFLDRHLPLIKPYTVKYGDRYGHPKRYPEKTQKMVLISNCGFPEQLHFAGMVETFRLCCSTSPGYELAGAILCSAGNILTKPPLRGQIQWYLDACAAAGREVAEQGTISPGTQAVLDRPIIDPEMYVNNTNASLGRILANHPE